MVTLFRNPSLCISYSNRVHFQRFIPLFLAASPLSLPLSSPLTSLWLFSSVYQDFVMFPAAPHSTSSAAHGCRSHHGKEGDESHGETLGERIQASQRVVPDTPASHPLQKCCVCTPKCVLGIRILVALGSLVLPCTLTWGSGALGAAPTGFVHPPAVLAEGRILLIYFIYSLWGWVFPSLKLQSTLWEAMDKPRQYLP